jgi:hypothetical protein
VEGACSLVVSLSQPDVRLEKGGFQTGFGVAIGFVIVHAPAELTRKTTLAAKDIVRSAVYQRTRDMSLEVELKPSANGYLLIPSTYEAKQHRKYSVSVFCGKSLLFISCLLQFH